MTKLPKLPEPIANWNVPEFGIKNDYFTEAQMLEYGRQCIEAARDVCSNMVLNHPGDAALTAYQCADEINAMLTKGETE
jgi:tRNA(His) 5'-end guanylyltransferase